MIPLSRWFGALWPMAERHGSLLAEAAATAKDLLADQRDVVVLHGDIHHGNVLDFGPRGWLAIDPKGLIGERTFDFVNILRNPETGAGARAGTVCAASKRDCGGGRSSIARAFFNGRSRSRDCPRHGF